MDKTKIMALIETLGLTYTAKFISFIQSRNKAEKNPSLNWIITISKGDQKIETDYMQGIGHLPKYDNRRSNNSAYNRYLAHCAETGTYDKLYNIDTGYFSHTTTKIPVPELIDVLYSLAMDSDALNYSTFDDWASEFGWDVDSRQAEKIYQACLKIALSLRNMIGDEKMKALQGAYQDY